MTGIFLVVGDSVFDQMKNEPDINISLILVLLLVGIRLEKEQLMKNKKKKYTPTIIISVLSVVGVVLFRNIPYNYLMTICMFLVFLLSYAIGKIIFRYKNFDKKLTDNDNMVNYKVSE